MPTDPYPEQQRRFVEVALGNPVVAALVDRLPAVGLPDCWLVGGALFQTAWNHLAGRPATAGIKDYDVFFFDATDTSWEREDAAIRAVTDAFADLDATVEVRNEARVHLWYEQRFGVPIAPFTSTCDAVDHFVGTTCCLGLRAHGNGEVQVYAPHGFDDLFAFRMRPNARLAAGRTYQLKADRWRTEWPALLVEPWPSG